MLTPPSPAPRKCLIGIHVVPHKRPLRMRAPTAKRGALGVSGASMGALLNMADTCPGAVSVFMTNAGPKCPGGHSATEISGRPRAEGQSSRPGNTKCARELHFSG